MFGTNDLNQLKIEEYESTTRSVVKRCLDNGSIVILSTIPPRSGKLDQCRQFNDDVNKISTDMKVALVDFFSECPKRRTDNLDGTLHTFKEDHQNYNAL